MVVRDDTDPRLATVIAGHGVPSDYVGRRIGIDEGMAGRVITSGEPVLVDDYGRFPRRIAHAAGDGLRAGAAVPIRRDGVVQGALAAGTTVPGRRFGGDELEALLRLAELGAVAIEQARMREELEQAVEAGVEAMAAAVDMRDDYTGTHSEEVVRLARTVGERMGLRRSSSASSSSRRACMTSARSACPTPCCASRVRWRAGSGRSCASTPPGARTCCAGSLG